VAGAAVRVLRIERGWIASASTIEIQVPFDRIGISAGTDLVFAVQVRDASDAILESVPHGGHWTIGVPKIGSSGADWQA
jgi:hypothetical protein